MFKTPETDLTMCFGEMTSNRTMEEMATMAKGRAFTFC